jgi:hypothetical protein
LNPDAEVLGDSLNVNRCLVDLEHGEEVLSGSLYPWDGQASHRRIQSELAIEIFLHPLNKLLDGGAGLLE